MFIENTWIIPLVSSCTRLHSPVSFFFLCNLPSWSLSAYLLCCLRCWLVWCLRKTPCFSMGEWLPLLLLCGSYLMGCWYTCVRQAELCHQIKGQVDSETPVLSYLRMVGVSSTPNQVPVLSHQETVISLGGKPLSYRALPPEEGPLCSQTLIPWAKMELHTHTHTQPGLGPFSCSPNTSIG